MIGFQCVYFSTQIKINAKTNMFTHNLTQYMKDFVGLYAFKIKSSSIPCTASELEKTQPRYKDLIL